MPVCPRMQGDSFIYQVYRRGPTVSMSEYLGRDNLVLALNNLFVCCVSLSFSLSPSLISCRNTSTPSPVASCAHVADGISGAREFHGWRYKFDVSALPLCYLPPCSPDLFSGPFEYLITY